MLSVIVSTPWPNTVRQSGFWKATFVAASITLAMTGSSGTYRWTRPSCSGGFKPDLSRKGPCLQPRRVPRKGALPSYNWWNLFVRLANPHKHHEAITSRPLLLHGVATKTQHGGQTTLTITSQHAKQADSSRADASRGLSWLTQIDCGAVDRPRTPHAHLAARVCKIPPRTNLSGRLIGARIGEDESGQLPFLG